MYTKRYHQPTQPTFAYLCNTSPHMPRALTGVLAKQVCPLGQPAPVGQSIAQELTASTHDVPQKFPLACTTTGIVANAAAVTDAREEMFSFMML